MAEFTITPPIPSDAGRIPSRADCTRRVSFGGNVGFLADFTLVGNWNVNFHNVTGTAFDGGHFKGKDPTYLQFAVICGPGPNPPPANANFSHFIFEGSYNGVDGYRLHVWAAD